MGDLNIYNLAEKGVVVDKSPIHTEDGELLQAQNAVSDSAGVEGAVRKRDGITKLNSVAMAGAVTGMIGLPLPDEAAKTVLFYAPIDDGTSNTFRTITTGGTVATVTSPSKAVREAVSGNDFSGGADGDNPLIWASHINKMYYPGNDYTPGTSNPTVHCWDGTDDNTIAQIPASQLTPGTPSAGISSIVPYSATQLLVWMREATGGTYSQRLLLLDIATGAISHIATLNSTVTANLAAFIFNGLFVWQGRIWFAGKNGSGAAAPTVWSVKVGDAAPLQDLTSASANPLAAFTSNGYAMGFASFKGNLYMGTASDIGAGGRIFKRTQAGVWSSVKTSDGTNALNYLGPLIVDAAGAKIYAYKSSTDGSPKIAVLESSDGSSWSTSYDISANVASGDSYQVSGQPILDPDSGSIYWPLGHTAGSGGVLKLTSGGVWSQIVVGLSNMRGPLMFTRT